MYCCIIVSLLVISVCVGENGHQPHEMAKKAISSQSFNRQDIPVSYKFNTVHSQSSPSPDNEHDSAYHQPHYYYMNPLNVVNIQYAPLMDPMGKKVYPKSQYNSHEKSLKSRLNYEKPIAITTLAPTTRKDYLEPRMVPTRGPVVPPQPINHVGFIPGHNIEVLRSVSRNPVTNNVFRNQPHVPNQLSIPDHAILSAGNPYQKVNFLNNYRLAMLANRRPIHDGLIIPQGYQDQNLRNIQTITLRGQQDDRSKLEIHRPTEPTTNQATTVTTTVAPETRPGYNNVNVINYANNQLLQRNQNLIEKPVGNYIMKMAPQASYLPLNRKQKSPYTKMHTLLINVARAYNVALSPHKSALHGGVDPAMQDLLPSEILKKRSSFGQLIPHNNQQGSLEFKTLLYPVQRNPR